MNIIGIDSSKVSTAMAIKSNKGEFLFNYTTKKEGYKWIKQTNHLVKYYHFETKEDKNIDTYSDSEVKKLIAFSKVSNEILKDVLEHIDKDDETIIRIEGYSYGSTAGDIIDLVGIGQSIRLKIVEKVPNISKIEIIAPKRLKTLCCEFAYGEPTQAVSEKTGKLLKKWIPSRNNMGIVGGDFTKHEMFESMKDCDLDSPLKEFYKDNYENIYNMKTFLKPFEDINDSIWLLNVKN
jgi:hypothetical protein